MKKIFAALSIILISACSSDRIADLTIIIPDDVPLNYNSLTGAEVRRNISGRDERPVFLMLPLGFPTLKNAVNDALKNGNGNAMTNVRIAAETDWYLLWGFNRITVNGNVIRIPAGGNIHE